MKKLNLFLATFVADESGQDLIEYALIASVIALVAVSTFNTIGTKISTILTNVSTALTTAAGN